MTRPDQQADYPDETPHDQVVENGNPGVPQSEFDIDDDHPAPGPATQAGSDVSVGPTDTEEPPEEPGHL